MKLLIFISLVIVSINIKAQVFLEPDSNFISISDSIPASKIIEANLREDTLAMRTKELTACDSAKAWYINSVKEKEIIIKQQDFQLYNQNVMIHDDRKEIKSLQVSRLWSKIKSYTILTETAVIVALVGVVYLVR